MQKRHGIMGMMCFTALAVSALLLLGGWRASRPDSSQSIPVMAPSAQAVRRGDRGDIVQTIQEKLKRWYYYHGTIDGIFGARTEEAVRFFQRKNGLSADGIVGRATAAKLGITNLGSGSVSIGGSVSSTGNESDINLLARLIYAEARGEIYRGQVAVGGVVINRVKHREFPNSISSVIYQSGAFSVVANGQINLTPDATALQAARDALNGSDPSGGAVFYCNPQKTVNQWILNRPVIITIGNHRFYS